MNIYELRLKDDFIEKLSDDGKSWLARAIVNLLIMDGKLDPSEMSYMKDAVVLVNDSERNELLDYAKTGKKFDLEKLTTDKEKAPQILYYFAGLLGADNRISVKEAEFFKIICTNLGYTEHVAREALQWTLELIKLHKQRTSLEISAAKSLDPTIPNQGEGGG